MKKTKYIFLVVTFFISLTCAWFVAKSFFPDKINLKSEVKKSILTKFQSGDIIFQTSKSSQSEAVRIATKSKFSHCGIIYTINGEIMVLEAVQPVKITPLEEWISNGKDNKYLVKRLKDTSILNPIVLEKMEIYSRSLLDKDYDLYFGWSDDKFYCSELVWKIYKNGANIELCPLQKLKDFNLKDEKVETKLKERYGNAIPLAEKVVSPSNLLNSNLLKTVIDTF